MGLGFNFELSHNKVILTHSDHMVLKNPYRTES